MNLKAMFDKFSGFFNSADPEKEIHLLAYGLGIISTTVWLSIGLSRGPIDGNWCTALGVYLVAVTGGLFKGGSNSSKNSNSLNT